jgi:argininosuccinate synthase
VQNTLTNDKYYDKAIKYLIYGNVLKIILTVICKCRTCFQAIEAIKYAKSVGASAIAHGSTGAGNDQIRFDLIFQHILK